MDCYGSSLLDISQFTSRISIVKLAMRHVALRNDAAKCSTNSYKHMHFLHTLNALLLNDKTLSSKAYLTLAEVKFASNVSTFRIELTYRKYKLQERKIYVWPNILGYLVFLRTTRVHPEIGSVPLGVILRQRGCKLVSVEYHACHNRIMFLGK